ncbi:MAG: DUF4836 family protein [Opitutales bacterium]
MNIYIHKDGQQYGPFTLDQLREYVSQGSFSQEDLACYDGQNWVAIAQIPGFAQTQPVAAPGQPVAQSTSPRQTPIKKTARQTQVGPQTGNVQQVDKGNKKKLIIWGSVGALVLITLIVSCIIIFSGDDDDKTDEEVAGDKSQSESDETSATDSTTTGEGNAPSAKIDIPLIARIPSDAGAVIFLRIDDILSKGEEGILALLPEGVPPMIGNVIKNPSSVGLDVSEPIQMHISPVENPIHTPTIGIAGKLSDKDKFMNTFELVASQDKPIEKNGYQIYEVERSWSLVIGPDFFYIGGADKPKDVEPSIVEFMTTDGTTGLLASSNPFSAFTKEKHDLSIWFGGDAILEYAGYHLDGAKLDTLKDGTGKITLNFEDGEMVAQVSIEAPNNDAVYGKGGFSDGILSLAPADAIFALGFAFDLSKFIEFAEKEILPDFGDEIKLDESMPELGGLSPRDVISSFTGEFLASLTDVKMPDPSSEDGFPGGEPSDTPEENPFGGDTEPTEANPFGGDMKDDDAPFPSPGGGPSGNMDPSAMMMASMPKPEFIIAASIDTEKWLKLKAAPPLAMGLGLAMMQGYTITEKNDFLIIASKDHIGATQSGLVSNPLTGSSKALFKENDFLLKINVAPILKMDLPIPPGEPMEMLKKISHLEMASNSGKTNGTGTFRIALNDKSENSLNLLLEMIQMVQTMKPMVGDDFDMDEDDSEFDDDE